MLSCVEPPTGLLWCWVLVIFINLCLSTWLCKWCPANKGAIDQLRVVQKTTTRNSRNHTPRDVVGLFTRCSGLTPNQPYILIHIPKPCHDNGQFFQGYLLLWVRFMWVGAGWHSFIYGGFGSNLIIARNTCKTKVKSEGSPHIYTKSCLIRQILQAWPQAPLWEVRLVTTQWSRRMSWWQTAVAHAGNLWMSITH